MEITLTPDVEAKLTQLAAERGRAVNDLVGDAIEWYAAIVASGDSDEARLGETDEIRARWREQIERGWQQAQAGQVIDGPPAMAAIRQDLIDRMSVRK